MANESKKTSVEIVGGFGEREMILWELEPNIVDYRRNEQFSRRLQLESNHGKFFVHLTVATRVAGGLTRIHGVLAGNFVRDDSGQIIPANYQSFSLDYDTRSRKGMMWLTAK